MELILTRPAEKNLIEQAKGLRFLVFDELHTYRGRQGADGCPADAACARPVGC